MYLVGNSFHVSFKWVVIISTKQEAAHTQSAKVSTCYTLWHFGDGSLITGRGGYKLHKSCEVGLTWELEILAIVIVGGVGVKSFHPLRLDYGG